MSLFIEQARGNHEEARKREPESEQVRGILATAFYKYLALLGKYPDSIEETRIGNVLSFEIEDEGEVPVDVEIILGRFPELTDDGQGYGGGEIRVKIEGLPHHLKVAGTLEEFYSGRVVVSPSKGRIGYERNASLAEAREYNRLADMLGILSPKVPKSTAASA